MSFYSEGLLFEGFGGSIHFEASVENTDKVKNITKELNSLVKAIFQFIEIDVSFSGSGYRVYLKKDEIFQHGFLFHLQLGSKKVLLRIP